MPSNDSQHIVPPRAPRIEDQIKGAIAAGTAAHKLSEQSGLGNGAKHKLKEKESARRRSRENSKDKKTTSGRGRKAKDK